MDLAGDDPASDGGERGESEMSPDSVPVSPGEPDPLPQLKRPTGVADIREDSNVGPDSADPDNLQEAYVDFGNKEANASIRDFSIDDFDEEGLIAETPTLHFMYSSPQFDGQRRHIRLYRIAAEIWHLLEGETGGNFGASVVVGISQKVVNQVFSASRNNVVEDAYKKFRVFSDAVNMPTLIKRKCSSSSSSSHVVCALAVEVGECKDNPTIAVS
ncbi:uncharacterized protein LOC109833173 [Asparagus officinalis]|uniref:uncharacterized protein LOC109833173 n=1 Tax=Asparagus officinalis TaxID=4686 RepID=UPI00098E7671|nr:uncharacterized protein LOC109833173 [Asparagus officinalis]